MFLSLQLKDTEKQHINMHLDVYKKFYDEQLEIKLRYRQPLHECSVLVVERHHVDKQHRIDKLHDKQKAQMLSLMHSKRKYKVKELQQKHKDRHELAR